MGSNLLAALIVLFLLAALAATSWYAWIELADVPMGEHGWYALAAGVVVTVALGIGLMRLVYISHKRGYDEDAAGGGRGRDE